MDSKRLRSVVTIEMGRAVKEHNPLAELLELEHHLEMQIKRVRGLIRPIIRKVRNSRQQKA